MNELKNLTNVVIGQLSTLLHKENCSHDFVYFLNYNIIIIQVAYINIETKEVARIGYNMFPFLHSYSDEGLISVVIVSAYILESISKLTLVTIVPT
jgi:hypothetical protein